MCRLCGRRNVKGPYRHICRDPATGAERNGKGIAATADNAPVIRPLPPKAIQRWRRRRAYAELIRHDQRYTAH